MPSMARFPGRNTVGSADIINRQIKGHDIHNGAVKARDIHKGAVRSSECEQQPHRHGHPRGVAQPDPGRAGVWRR